MIIKSFKTLLLMIMVVLFCSSVPAYADIGSTVNNAASEAEKGGNASAIPGIVRDMLSFSDDFKSHASKWGTNLKKLALWLFFTLGGISIVWTFVDMVLRQGNIGDIFGEIAKFCVVFGLFLFFVEYGDQLAAIIFHSFEKAAGIAEGSTESPIRKLSIYVDGVPNTMWEHISLMAGSIEFGSMMIVLGLNIVLLVIMTLIIMFILALIMVEIIMTQLTLWILMYAGVFVLGFGGCKWGRSMAVQYFKQVMSVAASYMCVLLIALAACSFLNDSLEQVVHLMATAKDSGALAGPAKLASTVVLLILCYLLIQKVPTLFGSMFGAVGYSGSQGTMTALHDAKVAATSVVAGAKFAGRDAGKTLGDAAGVAKGIGSNMKMAFNNSKTRQATEKMNKQMNNRRLSGSSGSKGSGSGSSSGSGTGKGQASSGASGSKGSSGEKPPASSERYHGDKGDSFIQAIKDHYNSANSSTRSAANEDKVRHNAQEYAETKAAYEKAGGNPESVKTSNIKAGLSALGEGFLSGARAVVSPVTRLFKK